MKIEYYLSEIYAWLLFDIEDYINLIFKQEDQKIKKIKSLNHLPIKIILDNEEITKEKLLPENLISGNYVEVFLQQELSLIGNTQKKGKISLISNENNRRPYDIWARAKIVSYDSINNILFLEYNEQLILIEDMNKIRPLSEQKKLKEDIGIFHIKKISNSEYEKFKSEYEKFKSEIEEEKQCFLYHNFNSIKSSLLFILPKRNFKNLLSIKELEEKYSNNEETNTNSGFSSRSGKSEESDKIKNFGKIYDEEDDILNQINKYKYTRTFVYKSYFKKNEEKILKNLIIKNKYYISLIDSEEFKIIIYGNDENDFNEEKNILEKEYKAYELKVDININKTELTDFAGKTKIKYIYFGKKIVYLIGEEKYISSFKAFISMKMMYSKEIQKSCKEKENIEKKLNNIKKEYKIK